MSELITGITLLVVALTGLAAILLSMMCLLFAWKSGRNRMRRDPKEGLVSWTPAVGQILIATGQSMLGQFTSGPRSHGFPKQPKINDVKKSSPED